MVIWLVLHSMSDLASCLCSCHKKRRWAYRYLSFVDLTGVQLHTYHVKYPINPSPAIDIREWHTYIQAARDIYFLRTNQRCFAHSICSMQKCFGQPGGIGESTFGTWLGHTYSLAWCGSHLRLSRLFWLITTHARMLIQFIYILFTVGLGEDHSQWRAGSFCYEGRRWRRSFLCVWNRTWSSGRVSNFTIDICCIWWWSKWRGKAFRIKSFILWRLHMEFFLTRFPQLCKGASIFGHWRFRWTWSSCHWRRG